MATASSSTATGTRSRPPAGPSARRSRCHRKWTSSPAPSARVRRSRARRRRDRGPRAGHRIRRGAVDRGRPCAGPPHRRRHARRQPRKTGRGLSRSRWNSGRRQRFGRARGNGRRPNGRPPRFSCSVLLDDPGSSRSPNPHLTCARPRCLFRCRVVAATALGPAVPGQSSLQSFGGSRCGG